MIINELNKWGKFKSEKDYDYQCELKHFSKSTYLNVIFTDKCDVKGIETILNIKLPQQIRDFYKMYNGANLFSQSMRIFGLTKVEKPQGYIVPNIIKENTLVKLICNNWDSNYIAIGNVNKYQLCISKDSQDNVYIIDKTDGKCVKVFSCFNEAISYCINELSKCYNSDGYKLMQDGSIPKIPLHNMCMENIF